MLWLIITVIVVVIVLTALYHYFPAASKTIVFFGSSLGVGATVVAATFAFLEVRNSAQYHSDSVRHSQRETAFHYMRQWNSLPLAIAKEAREKARGKSPIEVNKMFAEHPEYAQAITTMLNFLEEVGLAARFSYADEAVLCYYFEDPVRLYYADLQAWIEWYRREANKPRAFEPYELIHKRWYQGCPANAGTS